MTLRSFAKAKLQSSPPSMAATVSLPACTSSASFANAKPGKVVLQYHRHASERFWQALTDW